MDGNEIQVWQAKILRKVKRAKDIFEFVLDCDFPVTDFSPGQFLNIAPLSKNSAMARPFSVYKINSHENSVAILFKVVGENTELLSQLRRRDKIKVWGPLGTKSDLDLIGYDECWLIGGGMGFAPLYFFETNFWQQRKIWEDKKIRFFYGGKTLKEMVKLELHQGTVRIATEDGSDGYHGLVTDCFAHDLAEQADKDILVITCGPKPMMKQVAEICAERKINCYVVLETIMACGIGVCLGCSIETTQGMKRICHDGPVFKAEEVMWNEI
ncbi:MAG: dihydroorotate dehydrogenase electron transfer subunit [Candidatus Parcubacteria bacterium]|nr:dihydroorotate dehydrogenase electron transfer subunit [Candidatus Parcubacteria bacterium]